MATDSPGLAPRRPDPSRRAAGADALTLLLAASAALLAPGARAQSANCDEFKAALAERIDATGARGYSLDTAAAGTPLPAGAKVVGTCDGGATLILYRRWAAARPASAAEEAASRPARAVPAEPRPRAASAPVAAASRPSATPATGRAAEKPAAVVAADSERQDGRAVDAAVAQLAQVPLAFDPPAEMTLGETVQIRVGPATEPALRAIQRALGGGGPPGETPVAAARRLEAKLSGPHVRLGATTPKDVTLASAGRTLWQWQLEPTLAGPQTLQLSVSAEYLVDGVPTQRSVHTIERAVVVKLPLVRRVAAFANAHWPWLLALVLLPLAGAIWAWRARYSAYDAAGLPRGPKLRP